MTYSQKLRSPKWQKKRLEILNRDNFTCCLCSDTETELQVHHTEYNGEPWEVESETLKTLCKHCHELETALNKINKKIVSAIKAKGVIFAKDQNGHITVVRLVNDKLVAAFTISDPKTFAETLLKIHHE